MHTVIVFGSGVLFGVSLIFMLALYLVEGYNKHVRFTLFLLVISAVIAFSDKALQSIIW